MVSGDDSCFQISDAEVDGANYVSPSTGAGDIIARLVVRAECYVCLMEDSYLCHPVVQEFPCCSAFH